MKTKKIISSTAAVCLLMAIASITFYSCKKKPFDDISVVANSNFTATAMGVVFEDAVTGEPVGFNNAAVEVTVGITGENASQIVSIVNNTDFGCADGFLSLALKEGGVSSNDNPIEFTITAKADGFISTSVPVIISGESGTFITVPMVSIANAPSGVAITIDNTSLGAGEASSATGTTTIISISSGAATGGSDATTATIDIPTGQLFYTDDTHSERVTEAIEVSFAKFSATEGASLDNFPGTLLAKFDDNSTGKFTTAGLISLEMKTASGTEVTSFEKPITVTTGVPSGIIKPDGTEIIAGDTIPVWSHSQTTGNWTYEGNATITDNGGTLETTYSITHLSNWNIDHREDLCISGATINFTGNASRYLSSTSIMFDKDGEFLALGGFTNFESGTKDRISYGSNEDIQIIIVSPSYYSQVRKTVGSYYDFKLSGFSSTDKKDVYGRSTLFNGCTGNTTINVIDPDKPQIIVTAVATCGGSSTKYLPSIPVFAADVTAGEFWPKSRGYMVNGELKTYEMQVGHTYTMYTWYKKKPRTYEFKVDAAEIEVNWTFSQNFCDAFQAYLKKVQ